MQQSTSPDVEILERLKAQIKSGKHESYAPVPQPAALASLYLGPGETNGTTNSLPPKPVQDSRPGEYRPERPEILERRGDRYVPADASDRDRDYSRDYPPRDYDYHHRGRSHYDNGPVNHPGLPPLASGGDRYYPAGERERERERDYRYSRHDDPQYRARSYSDTPNAPPPPPADHRKDDRPPPVQSEVALRALERRQQEAANASTKPLEERIGSRPPPSLQERLAAVPMPSDATPPPQQHANGASSDTSSVPVKMEPEDAKLKSPDAQPPSPTGSSKDRKGSSSATSTPIKSNANLEARLSAPSSSDPPRPRSHSRTRQDDDRPFNRDNRDKGRVPPPGTGDRYVPPYDNRPDTYGSSYRPSANDRAPPPPRPIYDERDRDRAPYSRDLRDHVPRDDIRARDYPPRDERPYPPRNDDRIQGRFRENREPAPDWQYDYDRASHDPYSRAQPPPHAYDREHYPPPPPPLAYDRARERSPIRSGYERPLGTRMSDASLARRDDYPPPPPPPRRDDYARPEYASVPRYSDPYGPTGTRRARSPSPVDPRDDRPPLKRTRDERGDRYYPNDTLPRNDGYYAVSLPNGNGTSPAMYDGRVPGRNGESYRPTPEYPPPPPRDYRRDTRDPYAPPPRVDDRDRDRIPYGSYSGAPRERAYSNGYDSRSPAPQYESRGVSRPYDARRY